MATGPRRRDEAGQVLAHRTVLADLFRQALRLMDANYASQLRRIALAENAYLEYLPEPVVPYPHSRFITHTTVALPQSATLLYPETLLPGRKHHPGGEVFQYDLFSSTLRAGRPHGPELLLEKFVVAPA